MRRRSSSRRLATDRILRRLEAMLGGGRPRALAIITGMASARSEHGIVAIGSGAPYRRLREGLLENSTLSAKDIVRRRRYPADLWHLYESSAASSAGVSGMTRQESCRARQVHRRQGERSARSPSRCATAAAPAGAEPLARRSRRRTS